MPQRVLLQPAPLEFGLHGEQYDALARELEAEDVLVRVVPTEQRRDLPSGPAAGELYDLVIHVGEVAGTIVGTAKLVELVRRALGSRESRGSKPRRVKIYLANGAEHEFILNEED